MYTECTAHIKYIHCTLWILPPHCSYCTMHTTRCVYSAQLRDFTQYKVHSGETVHSAQFRVHSGEIPHFWRQPLSKLFYPSLTQNNVTQMQQDDHCDDGQSTILPTLNILIFDDPSSYIITFCSFLFFFEQILN